eukprot:6657733-Pyramimonas_sp.AAC.1
MGCSACRNYGRQAKDCPERGKARGAWQGHAERCDVVRPPRAGRAGLAPARRGRHRGDPGLRGHPGHH